MVKSYLLFLRYALKNWLSKEKLVDESSAFDVSLTSHGDRVNRVHLAIESACSGIKPRRVILFLSREDWPGRLPKSLTRLCHRGLEVITCFADSIQAQKLDKTPFQFEHKLLGHPALDISNL
ncbi:MAG: hypothetical protein RLZZ369_962, partial [Pseudomonadota bacterium]